jgi:hypothetical protein
VHDAVLRAITTWRREVAVILAPAIAARDRTYWRHARSS